MPLDSSSHALLHQHIHQVRTDDVLPKPFRLQQLQVLERRAGVCQIFEVRWPAPVLQVVEVGDKGRVGKQLPRGQVVEVIWISEGLDKLEAKSVGWGE